MNTRDLEELIMASLTPPFHHQHEAPTPWNNSFPFSDDQTQHLLLSPLPPPPSDSSFPWNSPDFQFQPFLDSPFLDDEQPSLLNQFRFAPALLDHATFSQEHEIDRAAKTSAVKTKKSDGQPSKNLMAERRRRKRLNDRLSMLRSIVPKISKMDRTSILADTIEYLRELHEKIHTLREEEEESFDHAIVAPHESLAKAPPKDMEVKIENEETHIQLLCTSKPGQLVSTLAAVEALGLEIHQCVISCFGEFSFQASCRHERSSPPSCEDIKQALFLNSGKTYTEEANSSLEEIYGYR